MIALQSDYAHGAHPRVLQHLIDTNAEALAAYGTDVYSDSAKEKIRAACSCPAADIHFLAGGTQTNQVVIASLLRSYEGVIAAETGHVSLHEAGAIEHSGHKVLTLPHHDGRLDATDVRQYVADFYADENHEHMVFPGMVYISHPTEYGTLYSKQQLTELAAVCREYGMKLYLDGARLGYALASRETDITLADIAALCDVFYIGGTKLGALCGEAVVFPQGAPAHFPTVIKQHGALLAKGRLTGVQFDALFTDGLYLSIGRHAIDMAEQLKTVLDEKGVPFFLRSPTNQQFVVLPNEQLAALRDRLAYSFWEKADDNHTVIRLATGWATTTTDIDALRELL